MQFLISILQLSRCASNYHDTTATVAASIDSELFAGVEGIFIGILNKNCGMYGFNSADW